MLFAFKISLESPDANSAQTKITALTELAKQPQAKINPAVELAKYLSEKELNKLVAIVKEGGETYRMAKNFLNL